MPCISLLISPRHNRYVFFFDFQKRSSSYSPKYICYFPFTLCVSQYYWNLLVFNQVTIFIEDHGISTIYKILFIHRIKHYPPNENNIRFSHLSIYHWLPLVILFTPDYIQKTSTAFLPYSQTCMAYFLILSLPLTEREIWILTRTIFLDLHILITYTILLSPP